MEWLFLGLSIALEVAGTVCLKLSHGFTRPLPSVVMTLAYAVSIGVFNFAVKTIPISIAYAIWAGIGTASIAVIGILFFQETVTAMKVVSLGLIIAGCIGVNMAGGH